MKIQFVMMQFPVPSEAFAAVEIRALQRAGATVSVHTFRPRPANEEALLDQFQLFEINRSHYTLRSLIRGLKALLQRRALAGWMLRLLLKTCLKRPGDLWRSIILLPRAFDLLTVVERARPDVLHLFWGHYPSLLGLLVMRSLPSVVVTTSFVAYDLDRAYPPGRMLARRVPLVWTVAQSNRPILEAWGVPRENICVSYRGVEAPATSYRGRAKVPQRLLAVQRLVPSKRTEEVLRIFRVVKEAWPDATLFILGDGPERARLERMVNTWGLARDVHFTGYVSHEEVFRSMAEAEALLLMRREECLPNVVKEAMVQRCLCVVARSRGIEELVQDGRTGFIVSPGDVEAAAARINTIFAQPAERAEMAEAARAHVIAHFDADEIARERLRQWRRLQPEGGLC